MSYKIQIGKDNSQQNVTIRQVDNTDISGLTSVTAKVYTSTTATVNEYAFSAQDLTDLKAGSVTVDAETILGQTTDEFYKIILDGDTIDSESAHVAITLELLGKALNKQGMVDVYSQSYRTDHVLHVVSFLTAEVDGIENQESSKQKRVDYTSRMTILKKILNYE